MRWLVIIAVVVATSPILENPRVRAYRSTNGSLTGVAHGPGVVISLEDAPGTKAGDAVWVEDAAAPAATRSARGSLVIVQPLRPAHPMPQPAAGSKPGDAPFTGMSFRQLFENDQV